MPLNVHFQQPIKTNTLEAKAMNSCSRHNSNRLPQLLPLEKHLSKVETNSASKSKSKKNQFNSPRTHSFESIILKAMFK